MLLGSKSSLLLAKGGMAEWSKAEDLSNLFSYLKSPLLVRERGFEPHFRQLYFFFAPPRLLFWTAVHCQSVFVFTQLSSSRIT